MLPFTPGWIAVVVIIPLFVLGVLREDYLDQDDELSRFERLVALPGLFAERVLAGLSVIVASALVLGIPLFVVAIFLPVCQGS